jgi:outer membrane protein
MKFLNKFFFIFIFFFLNLTQANSIESIAYIDMDFIIKNSEIGKKTLDSINNLNIKNINELKKKEKILKDLENNIVSKKNIISKENFDNEVKLLREKANKFKNDQLKMVENFNNYKKKELDAVFSKISPIINSYMEQKSVKILLDSKNILIGRNDLNLTNDVLIEINKKVK